MNSPEIKGSKILLLGYGREGASTHKYLLNNYPETKVSIADQKEINPLNKVEKIYSGSDYLKHLSDFTTVIHSPGIPAHTPELATYQKKGGWVTTATNIFFSLVTGKTIGITGTKGKSTTSSLIAHILGTEFKDVRLVGNIGNPMLDSLKNASESSIFVIELSSHQLEDARFSPNLAVILNIVPEHLDYYKNFSSYQQAKSHITSFQTSADAVIFNPNHSASKQIAHQGKGDKLTFVTIAQKASFTWIDKNKLFTKIRGETTFIINAHDIPLLGNLENVLAAVTAGAFLGIKPVKIGEAIKTFKPLPHRLEYVGEYRKVKFYNDSLATIPEATIHALDALGTDVETLIAGGFDRGLGYNSLGTYLAHRRGLKNLILFPDTGIKIKKATQAVKAKPTKTPKLQYFSANSMEEAVRLAFTHTSPGKICLLSPASASYNLFRDYAQRGDKFKNLVKNHEA